MGQSWVFSYVVSLHNAENTQLSPSLTRKPGGLSSLNDMDTLPFRDLDLSCPILETMGFYIYFFNLLFPSLLNWIKNPFVIVRGDCPFQSETLLSLWWWWFRRRCDCSTWREKREWQREQIGSPPDISTSTLARANKVCTNFASASLPVLFAHRLPQTRRPMMSGNWTGSDAHIIQWSNLQLWLLFVDKSSTPSCTGYNSKWN